MNTEIRRIVLLPRFTTYSGSRTFYTEPLNVRAFAYANVAVWRGTGIGSSPGFLLQMQESPDLAIWTSNGASYSTSGETTQSHSFGFDWIRLAITLSGSDPAFTCWAAGDFALRTPPSHGGGQ